MSKIKKSELKSQVEKLQSQLQTLNDRIAILEVTSSSASSPLQLPLFKQNNQNCQQCNNDLSKSSACMSVNCPHSYKVTCHA